MVYTAINKIFYSCMALLVASSTVLHSMAPDNTIEFLGSTFVIEFQDGVPSVDQMPIPGNYSDRDVNEALKVIATKNIELYCDGAVGHLVQNFISNPNATDIEQVTSCYDFMLYPVSRCLCTGVDQDYFTFLVKLLFDEAKNKLTQKYPSIPLEKINGIALYLVKQEFDNLRARQAEAEEERARQAEAEEERAGMCFCRFSICAIMVCCVGGCAAVPFVV